MSGSEARRQTEPGGGRALVLAVAGIVLSSALLPWGVLGLALEVAAIVIAVRTLRRAKAAGRTAPGAHAAVVAAGIALAFFVVALAFVGIFYDEWHTYRTCLDRAITSSANDDCREQFDRSVRERLGHQSVTRRCRTTSVAAATAPDLDGHGEPGPPRRAGVPEPARPGSAGRRPR